MSRDQILDQLDDTISKLEALANAIDSFNTKPAYYTRASIKRASENVEDARVAWQTGQKVRRAEIKFRELK